MFIDASMSVLVVLTNLLSKCPSLLRLYIISVKYSISDWLYLDLDLESDLFLYLASI